MLCWNCVSTTLTPTQRWSWRAGAVWTVARCRNGGQWNTGLVMFLVGVMIVMRDHADDGTVVPGAVDNPFR